MEVDFHQFTGRLECYLLANQVKRNRILVNTIGNQIIVAYLLFNENLYSKEKINNAVDTFSSLLDRILSENPEEFIIPPL